MNLTVTDDPRARYDEARLALIAYLRHKVDIADWHAVADAAVDLRVLEVEFAARFTLPA